jgi:hypothetical protein
MENQTLGLGWFQKILVPRLYKADYDFPSWIYDFPSILTGNIRRQNANTKASNILISHDHSQVSMQNPKNG